MMSRIIPPRHAGAFVLCGLTALALALPASGAQGDRTEGVALRPARGPDGRPVDFTVPPGGATAIVFYSAECPISNAYSPTLNRLLTEFPTGSLNLIGLCADPDLSDEDLLAHARDFELKFPVASDRHGRVAQQLGARITPEVFVLDDRNRVRYHGRIDDQFAARQRRNMNSRTRELHDAVAAVLAGRMVPSVYEPAVGCPLPEPAKPAAGPTFTRDVAPILQRHCQECHRRGQVGPFPLETYEQARKRADDIAAVAEGRLMPPWKPAAGIGPRFKHDRSLPSDAIKTLVDWAESGAPEGDPNDLPPPPSFPNDWALGTPDLILEMPEPFEIPASGADIYRCFVIPTELPDDRYVAAVEYRPGNRRVVHHILSYTDTSGAGRKRDEADKGPGYACFSGPGVEIHGDLGGWAPGNEPSRLPEGVGRLLPRRVDVIMQVHYHPSGKPETDRSRIGVYFSKSPVQKILHWAMAINTEFQIPPGAPDYKVEAAWPVPADLEALAVTPHMHLLGRDMTMTVKFPDGRTQTLIQIPAWDFGWQNTYWYETPLDLPKGSLVQVVAHFDNSEKNPNNPNHPPKPVRFGEATTDEMCIGFIAVTLKGQDMTRNGGKDELRDILNRQINELRRRHEEMQKKQKAK